MGMYDEALAFATKKHEGQKDKSGADYINHPIWVAAHCQTEEEKIVGLLHDTVEDTDTTFEEIESLFGKTIRDGVDAMTKREEEDYLSFVERAMQNPIAKVVKQMDIRHNMDLSRREERPDDADFFRMRNKYEPAYRMITGHSLTLSEQIPTNLNDFELKHLIWNLYSQYGKDDRIARNMRYILAEFSFAVSDDLVAFILEELHI